MERVNGFFTAFQHYEDYEREEISVAIALKGGIVRSSFLEPETQTPFHINPSAGNVFLRFVSMRAREAQIEGLEEVSGKNGNYLTFSAAPGKLPELLGQIFDIIYGRIPGEEEFPEMKRRSMDSLRKSFREDRFRAWCYMLEFTELGKRFCYNRTAEALEHMTYEELRDYVTGFVNPRNSMVLVNGRLDEDIVRRLCEVMERVEDRGVEYPDYAYRPDPAGISDHFLVKNIRCTPMQALYCSFPDPRVTPTEKLFLLLYISELLFGGEAVVSADPYDASIVAWDVPVGDYVSRIPRCFDSEEEVRRARDGLLRRYLALIQKPESFGVYLGELCLSGVNFYRLVDYIQTCSPNMIYQMYRKADMKAVGGTIAGKGGMEHGG